LLAVLVVGWLAWSGRIRLLPAAVAAVVGFLAFSKVFSPQYVDWLVPLVPAAGTVAAAGMLVVLGLTHVVFERFHGSGGPNGLGWKNALAWWAFARDLAVVALYAVVVARLARAAPRDVASTESPAAQSTNSSGRLA
ncbi:MAG: hypothetical protein JOZ56_04975, partial [Actinobacteria bacterium]|nr:hypothetical protein [Actinomycetota bacterium]